MLAALVAEIVLTAFFLIIILGATSKAAPVGFAPIAIGLGLTLIHLISIPVTNTSVNPARSIAAAIFAQNGALGQVWLFILAPLVGGALGAAIWKYLLSPGESVGNVGREKSAPTGTASIKGPGDRPFSFQPTSPSSGVDADRIREHRGRQRRLVDAEMVAQHALQHGAEVGGRLQVAVLVEIGIAKPRPVGDARARP